MQQQVRRAAHGGVHDHRIAHGGVGHDVAHGEPAPGETHERARRATRHVGPDRLSGGRQRRMWQREAERLADDLRRGRRPEELAATTGRAARAAAELRGLVERQLAVGEARADRLHLARILAVCRWQRDATRHQHARQLAHGDESEHHGRQALVASRHAQHAAAGGQRADESPEHLRRIVAVREAVHHADRSLRAAVTGIGTVCGEWQRRECAELLGRRLHQEADFPVSGVVAECDRGAVGAANTAIGAEHQVLRTTELARIPAHAGVLRETEDVSARALEKHLGRQWKPARRARAGGLHGENAGLGIDDALERDGVRHCLPPRGPSHGERGAMIARALVVTGSSLAISYEF